MHINLISNRFILYFSLLVFVIVFSGSDASSQPSKSKITSPLTITNATDQEAECLVANVGTSNVNVNVVLVSNGSVGVNGDIILEPNDTAGFQFAADDGDDFFCVFNYSGRHSEIRAAARVVDSSGGLIFPQRAEATEN